VNGRSYWAFGGAEDMPNGVMAAIRSTVHTIRGVTPEQWVLPYREYNPLLWCRTVASRGAHPSTWTTPPASRGRCGHCRQQHIITPLHPVCFARGTPTGIYRGGMDVHSSKL
jgi:hypothetical protein